MDEIQQDVKPLSDDQDLAKALAGISDAEASADMDFAGMAPTLTNINAQLAATEDGEEDNDSQAVNVTVETPAEADELAVAADPLAETETSEEESSVETTPAPVVNESPSDEIITTPEEVTIPELPELPNLSNDSSTSNDDNSTSDDSLDPIKNQALEELRPLVDKLNIPAEEKFETYLLLIRSSDDKSLIAPAHQTALLIEDETKRAEALLDIIKEIEYLSNPKD